ncbi:MAG: 30S ribosomal protein S18 [Clostridia bacterium]|nr:30S ribosomal protein S18 [Clostridia bacterium]
MSNVKVEEKIAKRPKRMPAKKKVCIFCVEKRDDVDYKDVAKLRKFVSENGKISPRRSTGTCAKHQRAVTTAVKRARQMALLPFKGSVSNRD